MRQFKFGIPIIGAITLASALFGCADENPWGSSSKEKGSISLTLSTDSGIKTAKPVFRSEDDESAQNPNNLNTYINMPSPDDFSIKLVKSSTGEVSSWSKLSDFKEYIGENKFETGTYTLTAYYGEKGKQDFDAPYFEASTTFNVLSDQEMEIILTADLQNSMVKINYTDAFKNYMKDYHAKIRTEGVGEPITYGILETRPLFIEPNNANLSLHFTTKDKEFTTDVVLGDFPPMAKTLHNITFDLAEGTDSKDATLEIKFDDTLEEENVYIELTHELLASTAPTIECSGFENGQTIDMTERGDNDGNIIMTATTTDSTIASAILTIESSTNYTPSWGNEIDLCNATATQQSAIKDAGIKADGFGFDGRQTDMWASLDLTSFGMKLPKGTHKVTLIVTDSKGKESKPASVTFDSEEISLDLVGNPAFLYGAENGELTFDYNGQNPLENVKFTVDGQSVTTISCHEQNATRAAEKKTYIFTLPIDKPTKSSVEIKATYKGEKNLGEFSIPVTIPEYKIEAFDAFSRYAYAKISTTDPDHLSIVTQNIKLKGNGEDLTISERNTQNGIIKITGLEPSILNNSQTSYIVTSSITRGNNNDWINWSNNGSFSTEIELPIPNGNFEGQGETYSDNGLQVGGEYNVAPVDYHHTSSFSHVLPAEWATINTLTAWKGSTNKNTWFVVPSSWLENGQGLMRNVGYNHDGKTPQKSGGAFNTKYYCENAPSDNQLVPAAGEIFLGSYIFNGNESRDDGIGFASRPASISFDYDYAPINTDHGYAEIIIKDAQGNELGGEIYDIPSGKNTKTISFNYEQFGKKASKLIISFKSSNQKEKAPINIPSGSALNEHQKLGNQTIKVNEYHAVATGSVLKIDNVTANYGDGSNTPANAPKRTYKKKK